MKPTAILFLAFLVIVSSCSYIGGKRVHGNGVSSTQERSVGDFKSLNAMGSMHVIVSQAATPSIRIEADQNLLEYIETRNHDGTIEIFTRQGYNLDPTKEIKVYAAAPDFNTIDISASDPQIEKCLKFFLHPI